MINQQLNPLDFPLHGSRLIEASAGTGKTFTLALLYVRLVLGQGTPETAFHKALTPREILVVTFTDAAAEELRDRIRSRLVEAADCFVHPEWDLEPDDPLEQLRRTYPPEAWSRCAWQLRVAAESMDEAQISTIHSWCHRVLVDQAFDTRGLFSRQLVTETEELLAEVVRDYWRSHFYPLKPAEAALLTEAGIDSPAALLHKLRGLLMMNSAGPSFQGQPLHIDDLAVHFAAAQAFQQARAEAEEAFQQAEAQRLAFEAQVRAHWRDHWPAIEAHLLELRSSLNGQSHASTTEEAYRQLLDAIYCWASTTAEAPSKLKNFAAGAFKFKKGAAWQQEAPLTAFDLLKQLFALAQPAQPTVAEPEISLTAAILAHAQPWVKHTWQQRMKQRAEMGFDDLLIELERALNPDVNPQAAEALAASLRNRFPAAMMDEFQDTDPVQYRIFNHIYRINENNPAYAVVMIGDPKQAIYSFRGADIHTYLQARAATTGRHSTLRKNYRSTQGVVEACNALFQHAEQHPRAAFRFQQGQHNPIPFVAVEAQGRAETLYLPGAGPEGTPPLNFWYFPPEDHSDVARPLAQTRYRELAAEVAATQIVQWLNAAACHQAGFGTQGQVQQPLQAADIALLVRTGTEARLLRQALQARQVPSVYLSDRESVFASQEARDLLHWLHACAQPLDERLVKAALGTNTLALPLEQLAKWQEDELAWEEQMQIFQQLHWIWQRQGLLAMHNQLLQAFDLPARLMQQSEGERQLTNLLHLAEWLQQASRELEGEQALIRHLAEHLEAGDQQQLLRLESDAERVKIITIHKSKGLEYPLVLLPFIASWRDVDGRTPQVPWRQEGQHYQEIAGQSLFPEAWKNANDERMSEDMRLLYVALTRARYALWLGVAAIQNGKAKKPQVERSAWGYLLNGGQAFAKAEDYEHQLQQLVRQIPQLHLEIAPVANMTPLAPTTEPQLEAARTPPNLHHLYRWWMASYSAIAFSSAANSQSHSALLVESWPSHQDADVDTSKQEQQYEEQQGQDQHLSVPRPFTKGWAAHLSLDAEHVLHHFPAGPRWGTFLHSLLEWASVQEYTHPQGQMIHGFAAVVADNHRSREKLGAFCTRRRIEPQFIEPLWQWLIHFLRTPWSLEALGQEKAGFALKDLQPAQVAVEMEFMLESHWVNIISLDREVRAQTLHQLERPHAKPNQLNGLLKGFIDLVVEHQGRYYVVDWKSNRLGQQHVDYTHEAMLKQILSHRYDLQYVLYLLALHRLLKARLPDYDYDQHVGGAIYVFLRGTYHQTTQGLFCDKPPKVLIEKLDQMLKKKHSPEMEHEQGAN